MKHSLSFSASLVALAIALSACGDKAPETAAPAAPAADPAIVTADEAMASRIKLATITKQPFGEMLRVSGRIDFDIERVARIGATVTGRVTEIRAELGQAVKPGDVLARLHSSELGTAQLAYLKSRAFSELQANNRERARQLFAADVIGRGELQKRENEYNVAEAERRAARDQLNVLGMSDGVISRLGSDGQISSFSPVVSTMRGSVVELNVSIGQVVQPAQALFTVADLSRVWAVAEVPEAQADLVAQGQTTEIEVPALGNTKFTGKLIYVGQIVNPTTRTVLVRTSLENPEGRLKPAMLASMLIASRPSDKVVVANSAVVRSEDKDMVYVETKPGTYRATEVTLGQSYNGTRVVQAGVREGDKVVVEGAFHLNNQRTGIVQE
ncbi:efflux RND transporter periplasmic adaptor subunit [Pigmentiphaga litoralis]|uniref:Cobalt-zinc-cadmium efflux system membrane fusion protein n=1 Tax=Pigmentiphaga litoralis TaxID=516702 RepID=A0A7Y9LL79_9BURK|nr:efflux RND transporter periplasmic adaptor subunit [Pigmentiphaga litoralis]NYE24109.1 cobalt-zinc-cadmium efflux system membrane fusion protein [Pigmentiphaga litoralis]NYE82277.1 cobalt-zinc-cadmium efflux system membrane fusion protein [Pigmentiphaga litoralis]